MLYTNSCPFDQWQMGFTTATRLIRPKSVIPISFHRLKNHKTALLHPPKCDGRWNRPISLSLLLHSTPMNNRKHSKKYIVRSSMERQSPMEEMRMVENRSSGGSATPTKGFGHHVNKLSKWAVSAIFAAVVIWKHDAEVMWAVVGSIINAGNSKLLKRVFKQKRPSSALGLKADPGMPSSHAQALGYLTTYAALSCIGWQGLNAFSVGGVFAIISCGAYLAWLRVSEGLHSYDQVLVGALLGSATAVSWFWLWKAIMLKAFASFFWVRIATSIVSLTAVMGFLSFVIQTWRFGEV